MTKAGRRWTNDAPQSQHSIEILFERIFFFNEMRQSLLPLDRVGFFFLFFVFFFDNAPQSFLTLNRVVGGQPLDNA